MTVVEGMNALDGGWGINQVVNFNLDRVEFFNYFWNCVNLTKWGTVNNNSELSLENNGNFFVSGHCPRIWIHI